MHEVLLEKLWVTDSSRERRSQFSLSVYPWDDDRAPLKSHTPKSIQAAQTRLERGLRDLEYLLLLHRTHAQFPAAI